MQLCRKLRFLPLLLAFCAIAGQLPPGITPNWPKVIAQAETLAGVNRTRLPGQVRGCYNEITSGPAGALPHPGPGPR